MLHYFYIDILKNVSWEDLKNPKFRKQFKIQPLRLSTVINQWFLPGLSNFYDWKQLIWHLRVTKQTMLNLESIRDWKAPLVTECASPWPVTLVVMMAEKINCLVTKLIMNFILNIFLVLLSSTLLSGSGSTGKLC